MPEQKKTFCRICEPACPLVATISDEGKVTKLSPNPNHPSGGIPCHKGLKFIDIHNSPKRLDFPLARKNHRSEVTPNFERVSWDKAFDDIGAKLKALRDQYGPNSVAFFFGNPGVFDSRGFVSTMPLMMQSGSKMLFNSGTQDLTNKFRGAYDIYGTRALPIPDLANTQFLLCLGTNPKISHWTAMSQPNDSLDILKKVKSRGGKTVFVNPRKIESSMPETGETLLIKPGTDVYFLAAVVNELTRIDGINYQHVEQYGKNIDSLLQFVAKYPAEKVSHITGIAQAEIKQVAKDFANADGAAAFIATGIAQSGQGLLCHWLVEMLNFITGNLGRKGGTYAPNPFFSNLIPCDVTKLPAIETSIGNLASPPPGVALPGVLIPELIESGDIKALIVLSGNPLMTIGGEDRMRRAFEKLELMVATDIILSATGEMADYVLPSASWLERADINLIANGLQSGQPYIHYTDAMEPVAMERKPEWWITARLAQAMGLPSLLDQPEDKQQDGFMPINGMLGASNLSIEQLKNAEEQTIQLEPTPYDRFYQTHVLHADKKVECYPPMFESAGLFTRCDSIFEQLNTESDDVLKLISLRTNHMHNSWLGNVNRYRKGALERNPLHMCALDAGARGLFDGDEVEVFNEHGSIVTVLQVNDDLRPGAVAMSHGFRDTPAFKLGSPKGLTPVRGANCNQLMPSGKDSYEPLSNMSRLSAVSVQIKKAGV